MVFPFFRKGQGDKKLRSGARFDRGEWQLFYYDRPAPRGAKFSTIKKKLAAGRSRHAWKIRGFRSREGEVIARPSYPPRKEISRELVETLVKR